MSIHFYPFVCGAPTARKAHKTKSDTARCNDWCNLIALLETQPDSVASKIVTARLAIESQRRLEIRVGQGLLWRVKTAFLKDHRPDPNLMLFAPTRKLSTLLYYLLANVFMVLMASNWCAHVSQNYTGTQKALHENAARKLLTRSKLHVKSLRCTGRGC